VIKKQHQSRFGISRTTCHTILFLAIEEALMTFLAFSLYAGFAAPYLFRRQEFHPSGNLQTVWEKVRQRQARLFVWTVNLLIIIIRLRTLSQVHVAVFTSPKYANSGLNVAWYIYLPRGKTPYADDGCFHCYSL